MRFKPPRYSIKHFPFSPGIPWTMRNGRYVEPRLDPDLWSRAMANKSVITVIAYNGLIESFFSLSILEAFSSNYYRKLFWLGDKRFEELVNYHQLAKISESSLVRRNLARFPVPLFFDKADGAYINALNNYIYRKTYLGTFPKLRNEPILAQIFNNSLMEWNNLYIPRLRGLDYGKYEQIYRLGSRYILIFQGRSGLSGHRERGLNWTVRQVKELAAIVGRFGVKVIVCTNKPEVYHGGSGLYRAISYKDLGAIFYLLKDAWIILSEEIDFLYLAIMLSSGTIISDHLGGIFSLQRNAEFLGVEKVISTSTEGIVPMDIYKLCEAG